MMVTLTSQVATEDGDEDFLGSRKYRPLLMRILILRGFINLGPQLGNWLGTWISNAGA